MIIRLIGTSGSGKSHVVHAILREYPQRATIITSGRLRPLGYLLRLRTGRGLAVLGHYEIANGGIDTLRTLDKVYAMARGHDEAGHDVLFEGKCMSDGAKRVIELRCEDRDARVIALTTPLEQCVSSVRARGHNIAAESIARTARKVERAADLMRAAGVPVHEYNRANALGLVREWLNR